MKHSDEWGEPSSCESGDNCPYCHTRTEQQFHPEVHNEMFYKLERFLQFKNGECKSSVSSTE